MNIINIPQLINDKKIDVNQYHITDNKNEAIKLIGNGFICISKVKDKYYFLKTSKLLNFLRKGDKSQIGAE